MVIEVGKNVPYTSLSPVQSYSLEKGNNLGDKIQPILYFPNHGALQGLHHPEKVVEFLN